MMVSFFKFLLVATSILFACASQDDAALRGSKNRNLVVRVKICFKGRTRLIARKRLKYFVGLGATRGACRKLCPADAKLCPDGSYVYRDPSRQCKFKRCPTKGKCCDPKTEPVLGSIPFCEEGSACCPDGTWGCSIGDGKTFNCGGKLLTSGFGQKCSCANDTKVCPDGVILNRDPSHNCDFQSCPKPQQPKCCDPLLEPGADGTKFPCRGEGYACCPDGTWACSIGDGKTFPCGGKQITSGFGEKCPDELVCTLDVKECPDGSSVGRDPKNNCEFFPCETIRVCPADVKSCPDGSFVSRDPALGCAFRPCPSDPPGCQKDAKLCPDGTVVVRDPENNCEFKPCPITDVCTLDVKQCPDGTWVSRDPKKNCEFQPCPVDPVLCTDDVKQCRDGSYVGRDPSNKCNFYPCPTKRPCCDPSLEPGTNGKPLCIEGHACCPDGTWTCSIGDAKTFSCGGELITAGFGKKCKEPVVCPMLARICPDGSYVSPNPKKKCQFDPCPTSCCDLSLQPGINGIPICLDGHTCCPDGTWTCSIGDGTTFPCGGTLMTAGFGLKCPMPLA